MRAIPLLLALLLLSSAGARAGNIDLSTVPGRSGVQLTIYNSEDLTLVRERRTLVFKPGLNPLAFSWANTLIDPTSVELRFREEQAQLHLLDTTFPHDRPQTLYWNVQAQAQLSAEVEISYFTSGIRWSADYQAISTPDEKQLAVTGYVRVDNHSGEQYDDAQVRLVVGKINLVEKIAALARRPVHLLDELQSQELKALGKQALREELAMERAPAAPAASAPVQRPKEVEKEGLSEYFIYTIEGTETVPDRWGKRLMSFSADAVPLAVRHRLRPEEYGPQLVRLYLFSNDRAAGLGTTPLPDGQWRLFRRNGDETLSFLAAVQRPYVPIGDKVELNLGPDPQVGFEERERRVFRDNLWMRVTQGNLLFQVGDPRMKVELESRVAGFDEHLIKSQRIRNHGPRPIEVEVRRSYDGDVTFRSDLSPRLHDFRTIEYVQTLAPGERKEPAYEVIVRQGHNAKQNRVEIVSGAVRP